jgi:tetratricopeptide (TPR) repeat protein
VNDTANPAEIHPILESLLSGQPLDGLLRFQTFTNADPESECWAGWCLLNLDRFVEALELLTRARNRGFRDAGVIVALAHRLQGDLERTDSLLKELDKTDLTGSSLAGLSVFARALAARERGAMAYIHGNLREAITAFERGYELASGDARGDRALAWFVGPLGHFLAEQGRDEQALKYLNRAVTLAGKNAATLLISRAISLARIGRFAEAQSDLESAEHNEGQSPMLPMLKYTQGVVDAMRGLNEAAANAHLESLALARDAGHAQVEFYSSLHLAGIATQDDSFAIARAHLNRARLLAQDVKMHAWLALRHGALLVRAGEVAGDAGGLKSLEAALQGFESLSLERETGLVHLHLAEVKLRAVHDQGQERTSNEQWDEGHGLTHLMRVVDARHALGNGTVFAVELRGLPAVFEHLSALGERGSYLKTLLDDWRSLEQHGPSQITLTTLGGYGLTLDGKPIRVNTSLPRTVETLAYLLDKGEATLEQIQHDVFTEVGPQEARAYIHLVKQLVTKAIPGLSLPFSKQTRKYSLRHPSLRLYWDALEVKRALNIPGDLGARKAMVLYTGPFLPRSESAWAEEYRMDLEWSVARAGLLALEDLFQLERFEPCIELAERLLEINPMDIGVSVMLVRTVKELSGTLEARSKLDQLSARFVSQIGVVPDPLIELQASAWMMAN